MNDTVTGQNFWQYDTNDNTIIEPKVDNIKCENVNAQTLTINNQNITQINNSTDDITNATDDAVPTTLCVKGMITSSGVTKEYVDSKIARIIEMIPPTSVTVEYINNATDNIKYRGPTITTYINFIKQLPADKRSKVIGIETDKDGNIDTTKNILILLEGDVVSDKFTYKNIEYTILSDYISALLSSNGTYDYLIKCLVYKKTDNFNLLICKKLSCIFSLTDIIFAETLDTSNVTSMQNMFRECSGLESLDLSSFDTSGVSDMSYMFYKCSVLESLNLFNFNTSNVTRMNSMFYRCDSLNRLTLNQSVKISKLITDASLPGTVNDWKGGADTNYVYTK